ncbi:MAG: glycosyltransferase family 4 protein, partial [Deltaproteobacteria bacterium]|nr:glycosyltransferase family 4 protein [Deltaproteobacteria bacterium]
ADDPILGFTTRWICALAGRVETVDVVTMRKGLVEVPGNVRVYSVGKEKGYSEPRRVVEFYRLLGHILKESRIDACFSHMIPIFTVLAAPVLKAKGIPITTWYAHPSVTWILRVAHRLSDRMVASVPMAYPYRHDKLTAIGQGIDINLFSPDAAVSPEDPPVFLCAGRLSPAKDHPTLLRAAAILRRNHSEPFRVVIIGGEGSSRDESYVQALHQQAKKLALQDTVSFEPPVPMKNLPVRYRTSMAHVNLTPKGFGDKVALEAMACGRVCLVANEGFKETLGTYAEDCFFDYGDSEQLAKRMQWVLSLSQARRMEIGDYLRGRVESMHGLNQLAQKLVSIFESAQRPTGGSAG